MTNTIYGQVLTSTSFDSHGEQRDKAFLDDLVAQMPPRMPLNQHHDHSQPTVGTIENFRVEPEGDGWALKADVTFDGPLPTFGGFSFSSTELVYKTAGAALAVYVPFPYYRDEALLAALRDHGRGTSSGRWVKKSADVAEVALIVSAANLLLAPAWRRAYEDLIHPHLASLAKATKRALLDRGAGRVRVEFLQPAHCEHYQGTIELYFVPTDDATPDVAFDFAVADAIDNSRRILSTDWKDHGHAVKRIVHVFDAADCAYKPTTIIYVDGTARQLDAAWKYP